MEDLKDKIISVIQQYGVRKAAIFGSYAKGLQDEDSDVDLLIEHPGNMGMILFMDLKFRLEEVLQKKVDLVTYGGIHPYLRERILSEQEIIYEA